MTAKPPCPACEEGAEDKWCTCVREDYPGWTERRPAV